MSEVGAQSVVNQTPIRLGLALFISLLLHVALILDTHLQPARRHSGKKQTMQVRFEPVVAATPLAIPGKGETASPPAIDVAPPQPQPFTDTPKQTQQDALEIPLVGVPVYYSAAEVDVKAAPLDEIPFELPDKPLLLRVRYFIKLAIFVDEVGQVVKVEVLDAAPPDYWDETTVKDAYRNVHFKPAQKDGVPVRSRVLFYGSPEPRG